MKYDESDCNPGHNVLELYNVLVQVRFVTTKNKSNITNLVHKLIHEMPIDVRLRILGNSEISEKFQTWVET